MNSTIIIEDSEEEVIYVDASCDNGKDIDDSNSTINKTHLSICDIDVNSEIQNDTGEIKEINSQTTQEFGNEPAIKVIFRDESVLRHYRQHIKDFLCTLVQSKSYRKEDVYESDLTLEFWDNKNSPEDLNKSINVEHNESINDDVQSTDNNSTWNSLFTIDTKPKLQDDLDIPTYGKKYETTFEKSDQDETSAKDVMPKMSCFNCMGNHTMRECTLPRNQANVNKNRKEFNAKNNSKFGVRYHLSEEHKFNYMIPGQLSTNLRAALGLKDNELPRHIYRMRTLGYPPGWLEEARLQHSGLSLFNSDGVAEDDPSDEPGEITTHLNKDQYDIKKIYDFPGFNVPSAPGTSDEAHKFWAPQMQPMHSKQAMLLYLQGKEADDGYKRKKLKLSTSTNVEDTKDTSNEMEIDDAEEVPVENVPVNGLFIPPLPKEPAIKVPPPPESDSAIVDLDSRSQELSSDSADEATPSRTSSPSLSDLESIKKRLLVELEDTNLQPNSDTSIKNNSNMLSSIVTTPKFNRSSILQRSLNSSQGSVKSVDLGTPILQSTSPFNKLPSSENFSKNICDVMNYENLPDSTGKYEQMTGVLQKVRHTLAKLHEDS